MIAKMKMKNRRMVTAISLTKTKYSLLMFIIAAEGLCISRG